jgi:hypothetical protein
MGVIGGRIPLHFLKKPASGSGKEIVCWLTDFLNHAIQRRGHVDRRTVDPSFHARKYA